MYRIEKTALAAARLDRSASGHGGLAGGHSPGMVPGVRRRGVFVGDRVVSQM